MASCIRPEKLDEYKKAWKDKELNIRDLINMSSEDRTALFEKYAGKDAKKMNTLFEEKLVLKNKVAGLKNFQNKVLEQGRYDGAKKEEMAKALSEYRARQQERILSPKEHEAFLNDLADKMIGTHISKEVAGKIFELGAKADALKDKDPDFSGINDEYFKASRELDDYVKSQSPTSPGASIAKNLSVIGRNNLLVNPSTPIKTSIGQIGNSLIDFATRRLGMGKLRGYNPEFGKSLNKEAWSSFSNVRLNKLGMEGIDDTHILGTGEKFDVGSESTTGGKVLAGTANVVAQAAKISNKIAIDLEHVISFTKFYQKTWIDMADLMSSKIADSQGLRGDAAKAKALEIFKDSAKIVPSTPEGAMLRLECQKQAARVTSTNETWASTFSLGAKKVMNNIIPMGNGKKFPLGDFVIPIAKIPADIIANGIENAGAGIPFFAHDIFQGRSKIQSEDLKIRLEGLAQFHKGVQGLMRIGGTIGTAIAIANTMNEDDFQTDRYGNHFVHIGNVWVNTEYISAISPALAGAMAVKGMEGYDDSGIAEKAGEYVKGSIQGIKALPGIDEADKIRNSLVNGGKGIMKYMGDFFTSRGVPRFIASLTHGVTFNTKMPIFGGEPDEPFVSGEPDRPIKRLLTGSTGVRTDEEMP